MRQFSNYIVFLKKISPGIFKWCAFALAGLLLTAGILFAALQTDFASGMLINTLNRSLLKKNDVSIEVKGLKGTIPFNFKIGDLVINDSGGRWMQVHNSSAIIDPIDLLKGRLLIEKLHVNSVEINRLPLKNNETRRSIPEGFKIPAFLSRIIIEDIQVPAIDLDSNILGVPARFRLSGGVSDSGADGIREYHLDLAGVDNIIESLQASMYAGIKSQHLEARIDIQEPGKGILYKLFSLGEDFKCLIEGEGDLSDWQGKINISGRDTGELISDINIKAVKNYNIKISGNYLFADFLVDEKSRDITGKGADFKIDADIIDNEILFNFIDIKAGKLEAGYKGVLRPADLDSEGVFNLSIEGRTSLDKFIKGYSIGNSSFKGSINGNLLNSYIDLTYNVTGVKSDRLAASEIKGGGKFHFKDKGKPEEIMSLSSDGNIKGLIFRSKGQEYREEKIIYRLELAQDHSRQLNVKLFEAKSENLNVHTSGALNAANRQASLEGSLNASGMGRFYPDGPRLLNGNGIIDFKVNADFLSNSVNGFLKGSYNPLLDREDIKISLNDNVEFEGRISLAGEVIGFSDIKIDGGSVMLEGSGTYGLKGTIDSRLTLVAPDLSILSPYLKNNIGGSARVNCFVNGEVKRLHIASDTEIEKFIWNEFNADNISGKITANQKDKNSNGKITIEVSKEDKKIKAGSDFTLSGKDVSFNNIHLAGMQTEMGGSMAYSGDNRILDGDLKFTSPDLSALFSLYGLNVGGSATGEITFKPDQKKQNLEFTASAKKIIYTDNRVEDIVVNGSIADILGEFHFAASASMHGATRRGVVLEKVEINGEGKRGHAELSLKGEGRAGEKLAFDAQLDLIDKGVKKGVNISGMSGSFGSSQVNMVKPFTVNYSAGTVQSGDIDINVDSGNIKGFFNYEPEKVDGSFMINDMPLSLLALAGAPVLDGTMEGSLSLGGSPSSPDISGMISVHGARRRVLKKNRIPSLSFRAEYNLNKDNASGKFSLEGVSGTTFNGNISIPCDFSIYPFKLVPEDNEPVTGSITGEFDLAVIPAVFEIHDQTVTGRLNTNFDIGGNYGSPVIEGKAVLSGGTYENNEIGLLFKGIGAEISADNSGLRLNNFKADDGLKGRINGSGHLDFDEQNYFAYDINMALNNMQLARNDMLTTVLGGNAVISGTMKQHKISGRLIVEKADYEIVDKKTVEIPEVEITEINRETEIIQVETKESSSAHKIKFDLAVSSPGRIYIKDRGLDSEWKGDIKLEGTSDTPVITGKLSLVRGRYDFLSKAFTLTDGNVTFFGNSPPDPYFDVTGKSENSSITAIINLKGNIKKPVLTLTSEPVLPQDEILARILFGREVSQITPIQAVQLAAALNEMIGSKKGFDPLTYTKNLIGVDRLEIKPSEANPDESALSAGKYLNDNIYIEVERGASDESGKASVTWELTPKITVETEVGENAETAFGVNWKHDY